MKEKLLNQLNEIGLTEYQSQTYVAAVSLGTARPGELSEASGVPQARIYDVIDDLCDMGIVEERVQNGQKVIMAPAPDIVLEELKNRHINDFSSTVQSAISDLSRMYQRDTNTEGFVSMVSLEKSARRHIRRAIADADWWLTLSLSPSMYTSVADELEDAVERGVTVRLILQDDDWTDRETDLSFPDELRVRYRTIADTLTVADRSYGVFSSKHPNADAQPYIVTQEMNLVLLFQNYCEQIWSTSEMIQSGNGFPQWYLDPWRAITDLQDAIDKGDLTARVVGYHPNKNCDGEWTGQIVDYELIGPVENDYMTALPVRASLWIETDDETLVVGGWKATVEDVAASAICIDKIH